MIPYLVLLFAGIALVSAGLAALPVPSPARSVYSAGHMVLSVVALGWLTWEAGLFTVWLYVLLPGIGISMWRFGTAIVDARG